MINRCILDPSQRKQLESIHNEVFAATVFIMEHGRIEIGTPQSARLIKAMTELKHVTGQDATVPADYPMEV
jgi:hypothetical protein